MEIVRAETAPVRSSEDSLLVGLAQIAPIWLDRSATLSKVADIIDLAAEQGCRLVVFGEALVSGYPFWIERTDGARFDDPKQKEIFARYLEQGVDHSLVRGERQNFDISWHYARPDVTRLVVDRCRQKLASFLDET